MSEHAVLGVDWYRGGWVGVLLGPAEQPQVLARDDLRALIADAGDPACVGIDMPIGLPVRERRADALARQFVRPRGQSVFATAPAEVLAAATYAEANEIAARLLDGKKISQQSWALRHNIERVAEVADEDPRLVEVHPEVSFRELIGRPLPFAKTTWNGQALRRRALAGQGIEFPDELGEVGVVPVADVLDAGAAAWSARRHAQGLAKSLPAAAPRGAVQVIWY